MIRRNGVASRLKLAHYIEPTVSDWTAAAATGRRLAAAGHRLPITDLVVAAVVKRLGASLYSTDPDFDLIADLKRYWPLPGQ
jgi:predicted nucleic acid-binding protein